MGETLCLRGWVGGWVGGLVLNMLFIHIPTHLPTHPPTYLQERFPIQHPQSHGSVMEIKRLHTPQINQLASIPTEDRRTGEPFCGGETDVC